MKKLKLTSLLMAGVLMFTAAACDQNGDADETTTAAPATTTAAPETEAPDQTEDQTEDETDGGTEGETEEETTEPDGETTVDEGPKEVIKITTFYETGEIPTEDNTLVALMREELGVELDVEMLVGNLDERIGIMVASSEYPDLMPFNQQIVDNDGARVLDDLLPQYSNLDDHYAPYYGRMRSPQDGHLYYLPNFGIIQGEETITDHWGTGNFIQKAVLEEAGYPEITTLDEFFDVIEEYVANNPEIDGAPTVGFTILNDSWRNFGLVNPPQFLSGNPNNGNAIVDFDTEVAMDPSTTDIAKQYYQKLNEINDKGLLDREFASLNYDQYIAKLSSGTVLATMDQKWNMNDANTALISAGRFDRTYVSIPLVYDESIDEYYRDQTVLNLSNGFMLTTVNDDMVEPTMNFLNEITTERWSKLLSWGIEGDAYEVDENGKFYRTEEQRREQEDSNWNLKNKMNAFLNYSPKIEGTYPDGNVYGPGNDPDEFYAALNEYDKSFLDGYGRKSWAEFYNTPPENPLWYPTWTINLQDGSPEAIANTKASDTKVQMLPQVIMADDFEAAWQEFVAEYETANYDIVIDYINDQIQWRNENWAE